MSELKKLKNTNGYIKTIMINGLKNRNSVDRANVYHFVMEKQVDWILNLSYPYQNVYDINKVLFTW